MKLTIKNKLFIGFGIVLAIMVLISINNINMMGNISKDEHSLTELRIPTVQAGMELVDGIHLSLAGLRGYMILGKDLEKAEKFKAERLSGWAEIDQAMTKMDIYSKKWTAPENIENLNKIKALMAEFRTAQQEVEDISHSPENIPAFKILLTEAAPRAEKILKALTLMIDEEVSLKATTERKWLLKSLADSRGSFAIGLANIRAYLLSGEQQFIQNFQNKWKINEARFNHISDMSYLFNNSQQDAWKNYQTLRSEFSSLPAKMFELRAAKNWNLANYWLGTKAAPKATAMMKIINQMRISQDKLAAQDKARLVSETESMQISMIIGTFAALILGIGIAIFISRIIVVRLDTVVKRTQEIAAGNLTGKELEIKGSDEIADLTVAINDMSNGLKSIIEQISGSAKNLNHLSDQLTLVTEQTNESIYDQQSQTEQVAAAINEMRATVQEVGKNISGTAQAANEAHVETASGTKVVASAVNAIQQLASQLEGASDVIQQLERDSEDINTVLDVIKGIAEQTNLLALNAAIEAARAGEQGRGFAVVADEVRTLAGRTQESTEEINQVIEKLQLGSRKAVEVMSKSREDARLVVGQADQAGESLAAISKAVGLINDMSIQIASAAEQQSSTTEEINRNITVISAMANKTVGGAKETVNSVENVAELGNELQSLVSRFSI